MKAVAVSMAPRSVASTATKPDTRYGMRELGVLLAQLAAIASFTLLLIAVGILTG